MDYSLEISEILIKEMGIEKNGEIEMGINNVTTKLNTLIKEKVEEQALFDRLHDVPTVLISRLISGKRKKHTISRNHKTILEYFLKEKYPDWEIEMKNFD